MRLLLSGDIHIGRSSTRVADAVSTDARRASAAWERIVELAVDEKVDVLCLSGDVTDKENKFWEAIGPIEHGIERLSEVGVLTVAVAGNHDYDVFGRLADQLPEEHFRLLGRGGSWERLTIERGEATLHVDGWSFPRERVAHSPLEEYDLEAHATTPILGLLHGDLDVPSSPYAPLDRTRLRALPPDAWLLGHIHKPRMDAGPPWILYPGSPQALDFGEPGLHGVWMVEVDHALGTPRQRPLSTVRYEMLEIDVSGTETEEAAESLIFNEIRSASEDLVTESGDNLECLMLRVTIAGRTPLSHRMADVTDRLRPDFSLRIAGARVEVDRLTVATLPAVDVEAYAQAHSAPGALARLLQALEEDDVTDEVAGMIGRTRRELEANEDHKYFAPLERRDNTDDLAREHLRQEARALLTQLVAQTS